MVLNKKTGIFDVVNGIIMILMMIIMIYPLWFCVVGAFSDGMDFARGGVFVWPRMFTLDNFKAMFYNNSISTAFQVTILKCIVGTVTMLFFTTLVAYGMTRPNLRFKNFYILFIMIPMFFDGGLIPRFILFKDIKLYNTFWVYIIPGLFNIWNMIILQSFIRELPQSLIESAKMDGASEYRVFFRIVVPLSKPVLAAIALFSIVEHWNKYFDSMMYTSSNSLQTIQLYLKKIITDPAVASAMGVETAMAMPEDAVRVTPQTIKLAAMTLTALPIIAAYPFLQKYFVKGMMIGAVKG
jgi:putative aldouronate transport system permease protein